MADLTQYLVDLETQRPNPFDNTKVLRGDAPRTAFTKINDLIMALVGVVNHFGPEAPSPTYPFMRWNDTRFDPPKEMYRNAENTAWLEVPPVFLTALQIKELYESNPDTNAFTDADIAALANKVDKVPGKDLSDNNFTNAERDKLAGLESSRYKGLFVSIEALNAALPTGSPGDYADVDAGAGTDVMRYIWDDSDSKWSAQSGSADPITAAQVKVLYESNANTNAFTDTLLDKLNGIEAGATKLPAAADGKILRGVGTTWVAGDEITYAPATSGSDGLMTAAQFVKLSGIASGATANRPDSQTPAFPGNSDGKIYGLMGNELVEIPAQSGGGGELFEYSWHNGPRSSIGEITPGRIPADGQQITLLQYPEAVQAVLDGKQNSVPAAEWLATPSKRNCWGIGDGYVYVPDLNGARADTGKPFYLRGGPEGLDGTSVGDAIRDIVGSFQSRTNIAIAPTGAFSAVEVAGVGAANAASGQLVTFQASKVVPTADENRVKTAYGVWTVRVFTEVSNGGAVDAAQLATQLAVVDAKVQALDANTGFTIIYPNGGTQASPANVAINSRYVESNPFPGFPIMCSVELLYGGEWCEVKMGGSGAASYGADAGQHNNSSIVLITGTQYLITTSALHYFSGVRPGAHVTTGLPCRIKVWKLLKGGA